MERTRGLSEEYLTFRIRRATIIVAFALATLLVVTGCTYATATQPLMSDGVARLQDSLSTHASVDLGYYSQPRAMITGAVSSISLADGSRHPYVRSIAELLQGRIAGLFAQATRGGGVSLRVRGGGGEIGAAPLVIVDGDPLPSGAALESILQGIDASDVVRVDVLKDISATAIYGTRGSNGVVLITLRHRVR